MLKKRERLTKQQFDTYFSKGRRIHSPLLTLIFSPHTEDLFHGAVVVGKKVYKGAVERNRLRRQIYAHLRHRRTKHNLRGVYMVLVKPSAQEVPVSTLFGTLDELIGKTIKPR